MSRSTRNASFGLLALALSVSSLASASGSYGGGGGYSANQAYNVGKAAFYKKVICKTCPLAQGEPDADKAKAILQQLTDRPDSVAGLSGDERSAIAEFLKRRFNLE